MANSTILRAKRGIFREWRLQLLSVFSAAVAFVCLGAALLFVVNLERLQQRWQHTGRLTVYLQDATDSLSREQLQNALKQTDGVSAVEFISREAAQRQLEAHGGLAALPLEVFPEALEVSLREQLPRERVEQIKQQLAQIPGVDEVDGYEAWTERLGQLMRGGVWASLLLALVVLGAVLAVISSTLRMALQKRRNEVEILRMVGATDHYVRGPFLLEGALQGSLGALLALSLLAALFALLRAHTDAQYFALLGITPTFLPWVLCAALLAVGALIGCAASWLGLRRWVDA